MKKILFCFLILLPLSSGAQSFSGTVVDSLSGDPLVAASVLLHMSSADSLWTASDIDGHFHFSNVGEGKFSVSVSYVGYEDYHAEIILNSTKDVEFEILLKPMREVLKAGTVKAHATRAEQRGDSLLYNADAFKVMEGSTVEEMLSKMPGIVVEGGTVQAQGEEVKKVLVDGKEFFDGDVNLALKNLPADIIQSIEVFDKKSEQAEFTGFDDGEQVKTINIVTRNGYSEGVFGKVSGGGMVLTTDILRAEISIYSMETEEYPYWECRII